MKYSSMSLCCVENGPGARNAIFVSGCPFHCEGCHNREAWDYAAGRDFGPSERDAFIRESSKPYIAGITLLGGEPLCPDNIGEVTKLARDFKEACPDKTVWCYTGYLYEDVKDEEIMRYVDVLVDGRFEKDKRDLKLLYRGSSNQRVIDVKASREDGTVRLLAA